jgi:hypothetical protein
VLELDTEQLNAKPIRIKLKAGFYITGIIQMGAAIFCNEDQIPFISTPNLRVLAARRHGEKAICAVPPCRKDTIASSRKASWQLANGCTVWGDLFNRPVCGFV